MSIESDSGPMMEALFRDFSDVQIDPFLGQVFESMRAYNELLKDEFVTTEQINEIMEELDAEWESMLMSPAQLTGIMSFLPVEAIGQEGEPVRDYYEDETVVFNGVLPTETRSKYDDDGNELHTYELRLQVFREDIDKSGKVVRMGGQAAVDEIVAFNFPDAMSIMGAMKWLEYYHADDLEAIDVSLLNSTKEECEMILRLKGVSVDAGSPHKNDESLSVRSQRALTIYTNSLFDFDGDAPYLLEVDGDGWSPTGDEDHEFVPAYLSGKTMASMSKIIWMPRDQESSTVFYPHVEAQFLSESKDEPAAPMMVPVDSIVSLRSFRYDYFVGYDD